MPASLTPSESCSHVADCHQQLHAFERGLAGCRFPVLPQVLRGPWSYCSYCTSLSAYDSPLTGGSSCCCCCCCWALCWPERGRLSLLLAFLDDGGRELLGFLSAAAAATALLYGTCSVLTPYDSVVCGPLKCILPEHFSMR